MVDNAFLLECLTKSITSRNDLENFIDVLIRRDLVNRCKGKKQLILQLRIGGSNTQSVKKKLNC